MLGCDPPLDRRKSILGDGTDSVLVDDEPPRPCKLGLLKGDIGTVVVVVVVGEIGSATRFTAAAGATSNEPVRER